MATAVRSFSFHLAFIYLHASAAAVDKVAVHRRTNDASIRPHDTTLTDAGRSASSHAATSLSTTSPNDNAPRRLDVSAVAGKDASAAATTAASPTCTCVCVVLHMREVAVEDTARKALFHALPLLAVPFLPKPLAALVVLSSLAVPARSDRPSDNSCCLLAHATCTVYRYLPDGTGVDRSRPYDGVRPVGCGPRQLRLDGPFRSYCHVRTLEGYNAPKGKGIAWRVLSDHPPVADPDAVLAGGGHVCYVELEHLNHREGYYIVCPVRKCPRFPFLCCSDSPHDAVIWDRRSHLRSFRDAVGSDKYRNGTAAPKLDVDA
jgi:hypothetical protein